MEYLIQIGGVDDETGGTIADSAYAYDTIETDTEIIAYGSYQYDTGGDGDGSYFYKVIYYKNGMLPAEVFRGVEDTWYAKSMNGEEDSGFEEIELTEQDGEYVGRMIGFVENCVWFNGDNNRLYMREDAEVNWIGKSEVRSENFNKELCGDYYE